MSHRKLGHRAPCLAQTLKSLFTLSSLCNDCYLFIVIHCYCIKGLERLVAIYHVGETRSDKPRIVIVENHSILAGLMGATLHGDCLYLGQLVCLCPLPLEDDIHPVLSDHKYTLSLSNECKSSL